MATRRFPHFPTGKAEPDPSAVLFPHGFQQILASRPAEAGIAPNLVSPPFQEGWLTFKSDEELRRLAPIPGEWQVSNELALRSYLDQTKARVTSRNPVPLMSPPESPAIDLSNA